MAESPAGPRRLISLAERRRKKPSQLVQELTPLADQRPRSIGRLSRARLRHEEMMSDAYGFCGSSTLADVERKGMFSE